MNHLNPEDSDSDSDDQDYRPEGNETDSDANADSDVSANEDDNDPAEPPAKSRGKRKQPVTKITRGQASKKSRHGSDDDDDDDALTTLESEPDPARKSKLDALWAEMNASTKAVSSSSSSADPKKEETTPNKKSIDDIWKEMSASKDGVPSSRVGATGLGAPKKTVKVTENYVFAGETISVTKEVAADTIATPADTTVASPSPNKTTPKSSISLPKSLASSAKFRPAVTTTRSLPSISPSGPARPKSTLTALVAQLGGKAKKLNTLEKSKMDWGKFVDAEGIEDELKHHNKDGYMEKVAFLQRVDERRLAELKEGQRAATKKQ